MQSDMDGPSPTSRRHISYLGALGTRRRLFYLIIGHLQSIWRFCILSYLMPCFTRRFHNQDGDLSGFKTTVFKIKVILHPLDA